MSIERALTNVRRQLPIDPSRVAVTVSPPTSPWRLQADRMLPDRVLRAIGWQSDFARSMATGRHPTFGDYWQAVGQPVRRALVAMERTGCTVCRDAAFSDIDRLYKSGRFDLFCLIAHQVSGGSLELSDGPKRIEDFYRVVGTRSTPVMLFVCESDRWRDAMVRSTGLSMAGGARWRMPFRAATLFLTYWLRAFDGRRTADEALMVAMQAFDERADDEVPHD